MRIIAVIAFGAWASLTALPAWAGVSGHVRVANNYIWRGVTKSLNEPVFQGGIGYAFRPGFFLGLNGSTVHLGPTDSTFAEMEFFAGFKWKFRNQWAISTDITNRVYPGAGSNDFPEFNLRFSYQYVKFAFALTNNLFNSKTNGFYSTAGFDRDFGRKVVKLNLHARVGHFKKKLDDGSYSDVEGGIGCKWRGAGADLSLTGTIGRKSLAGDLDSNHAVFSVWKEF